MVSTPAKNSGVNTTSSHIVANIKLHISDHRTLVLELLDGHDRPRDRVGRSHPPLQKECDADHDQP